ncbi:sensor histidine kinase [Paenibacillus hamazuiensis]|uniref:sensor histidine kinase n=1 Tax=Paenibacillus hamazuiensis TaxID=2936508 RepID=UPI00200D4D04|nr:HAMP domain-containing sensor histidine kinase [Paenibacillus hamazuiensis]
MSIRTKLIISNFAMVIIPFCLFALSLMLLLHFFMKDVAGIADYYGGDLQRSYKQAMETIHDKTQAREELMTGFRFLAKNDPDRLGDTAFLRDMDAKLGPMKAGLIVRKQGESVFVSTWLLEKGLADLQAQTDSGRSDAGHRMDGDTVVKINGDSYMVTDEQFTFRDSSSGSIVMVSDVSPFYKLLPKFIPLVAITLLLVLVVTNGLLTFLVSRSIIKPLYALKEAAEQIKDGNLDHPVTVVRKDEIGQLGSTFEEMRVRLKQSIALQLQYEDNRKELLANISHDLKTPITAIKACAEGMADGIADTPEKRDKYVRMIHKKASDMDKQIDELFLFSKLDLGRVPFHLEKMNLTAYLQDCVEDLSHDPQLSGISVSLRNENGPEMTVSADWEKLRRVIQNIVDNSLKYMDKERKTIEFTLSEQGKDALVRIADNGTGIEPDALPHIFDRFYRAESWRSTGAGGSGLGLSIVKQIIEGHGGRVWAESVPGSGTTVIFTLPKASAAEPVQGGTIA